ncbi:MAG TPA: rhomboid family intramembrane serine protease [Verrucomicrobiae bacterium]|nr:rhomboid family intramembrane serine protease [Verrucomicrobiae bacterium]
MLADRQYMREPSYRPQMSLTVTLLIINVCAFILECFHYGTSSGLSLIPNLPDRDWFALSLYGLKHGYVWQLITYQFMHAGLLHLLLNGWALFMFGRAIEDTLGRPRFLALYLASGIFGGLLQEFMAWIFTQSQYAGVFGAPVVGASAAILGVVAAFAMLYPEQQLTLLIFYVIPVNIRAKYLLFLSLGLAALGISFPNTILGGHVAHAAHMGGILMGLIFIRYFMNWQFRWPGKRRSTAQSPPRELVGAKAKGGTWRRAETSVEDLSPTEFISNEVDPILDKISAHGIQSLTERERKILEAARNKMGKR